MKRLVIIVGAMGAFCLLGLYAMVLYNGPRMRVQQHFRAFQTRLPPLPAGTVPVEVPEQLPQAEQLGGVKNPLPANPAAVKQGQIYYRYYCIFCHGENGSGGGPVGESYVPVPADLRTQRVQSFSDGQLLRAMLTGTGHEPVLERVVPPQHRWFVVRYVRYLAQKDAVAH